MADARTEAAIKLGLKPQKKDFNEVDRPAHYADKQIETIDYLSDTLSPAQFEGFCLGNALKYISRAGKKGDKKQDLKKAVWYLNKAITTLDGGTK